MAFTSAYDLYLGDIATIQGYRCRSLIRDSAPQIAPKFASGAAGQTDLDLLKAASVNTISGGMFQRTHLDNTKVARALGIYNRYDENLYPALPSTSVGSTGGYRPGVKVESEVYSFMALRDFSAGVWYNQLYKVVKATGTVTNITLPAALASINNVNACNITGLAFHGKYLYVTSDAGNGASPNIQRYDVGANTWQDIGGIATVCGELRGILYVLNSASQIFVATNEFAAGAATYTQVSVAGSADLSNIALDWKEFNGAAWIAKQDGIYRFDGVACIRVLNLSTQQLQVFNGALYFYSGSWLYKFDGVNVTRLQYFGPTEPVSKLGLSASSDYLYVQTTTSTSGYAAGDKFFSQTGIKRVYMYDGVGFTMFQELNVTFGSSYITALLYTGSELFEFESDFAGSAWSTAWIRYDLANMFVASAVTTNSIIDVTTSEFDDGFPNIYKALENIEPLYNGLIASDSLVVKYQTYDGKTWSAWQTAGTITSATDSKIEITDASKKLFKRLKISATLTPAAGSTATLKGLVWRYTLQPRARWRWQAMIMAEGNSIISDRNSNAITADANAFSNQVLKAVKQKTPIFLFSPDYGKVKTGINSSALSFIVPGQVPIYTDPYSEYMLCAVQNANGVWEVLRVSTVSYNAGTDETTINVLERGYYGVTAASINANAEFHLAYKVYVTRLLRDQATLDDNTYNEQATTGESQLQREYFLEITEV